ncbi:MAG TPA: aldo/keto reductase [Acidobacteriota bacterium]|nr:aldo/keto reductase [Acidobacteriota bacterium]
MSSKSSRRKFLKTGLVMPAAGFIASRGMPASFGEGVNVPLRTLGGTGLKVSGVGCGIGFTPDPEVLKRAMELGVNYYDTSRVYGKSEEVFGNFLKGKKRDRIIISTKTGRNTREHIFEDIDTSLQMLGTDYVDVYHLHARDTPDRVSDEALDALRTIKKQGKARFLGLSTHNPRAMADFVLKSKLDVVLTTYGYAINAPFRNEALDKLHAAGIGIIAMKVVLAVTGIDLKTFDSKPKVSGEGAVAAIKWVLRDPRIGTTIPYHANVEQIEMNVRAMTEPYTEHDERLLFARNESIRPYYCRMCFECDGKCPMGVPVTDELRFLAYNDFGGDIHQARRGFMELPRDVRALRCSDCSACVVQCPNGVHVRERLVRAQNLLA